VNRARKLSVYEIASRLAEDRGFVACPEMSYDPGNQVPVMVRVPGRKTPVRIEVTRASYVAFRAKLQGAL